MFAKKLAPLFVGFLLQISTLARANDTIAGGAPTDLVPLESTDVRMVSEDIVIRAVGRDWDVHATYVFENASDKELTHRVGFPEYACESETSEDEGMCVKRPLSFRGMSTKVDGRTVRHTKGKITASHEWAPRLGTVWLYEITFPAKRPVTVVHRYRVRQTQVSDGMSMGAYVTRTGATWKDSIGHARFRVYVPVGAHQIYTEQRGLKFSQKVAELEGKRYGELTFEAHDWTPEGDIAFGYNELVTPSLLELPKFEDGPKHAGFAESERCPMFWDLWYLGHLVAEQRKKKPSSRELEPFLAQGIGSVRICRNEVFAIRGRRFEDDALNRYFYGPSGFVPEPWPASVLRPNPEYGDALLKPGDWATLRLIDLIEKRRKKISGSQSAATP